MAVYGFMSLGLARQFQKAPPVFVIRNKEETYNYKEGQCHAESIFKAKFCG